MQLILNRDYCTSYATLGRLTAPNGKSWVTIERPWVPAVSGDAGAKGLSCIPLGTYRVTQYTSDAHPNVWVLSSPLLGVYATEQEVPAQQRLIARTRCLIHPANWANELRGCIAPGKSRVKGNNDSWMVTRSRDAVNELRTVLGNAMALTLEITSGTLSA